MEVKIKNREVNKCDYQIRAKYIIQNKEHKEVGRVDVHYYCLFKDVEIKYETFKGYEGKGYATKAVSLVLHDIFKNKTLDGFFYKDAYGKGEQTCCEKITLQISQNNLGSVKVAEKNGFKLTQRPYGYCGEITKETYRKTKQSEQELNL